MGRTEIGGKQIKNDSVTGDDVVEETLMLEKIPQSLTINNLTIADGAAAILVSPVITGSLQVFGRLIIL